MSHTTMGTDFLQTLQIFTKFRVQIRRCQLLVFAIDDVLLSVQEPVWNFILSRVRDDGDDFVDLNGMHHKQSISFSGQNVFASLVFAYLFIGTFTGAFGQIDVGLFQYDVGVTTTNTFDGCHRNSNFAVTINVRIHDTKNVLKLLWNNQRL